ncbi:MAG: hypothetical protein JGK12_19170 [Microcoleus sp. PH2017_01_SCD_O_A]|uniref:hypothetical protein n=1 Tax=unclassified Microcoleus TaxID=2642155 RepID=UPI001D807559|nr:MULTISPECIES: hypothetical protein [unclassified Microcoleus]MCC3417354.1 hypothetical protein [Microcoleus sp. PH2017_07_MST_O_A]MCC3428977.1 hypothetical protein [Microcoleus sp. PH2017_04_SCI_O_A]TAE56170.1 MAG: hypothetical protein EAZ88_04780 [Oscillatoriales cyanobacterium]MCC3425995.1 hypothetical protein [Microcoleus sp. PH2017_01_SCD_O_A]MCC3436559.1 hypothetical protein [Microcoleus sp. PH2017_05_CCC_O_A]
MNVEQIDRLLAQWKQNLDRISQNLIDLHGLPTYQQLTAMPSDVELTGKTKAKVVPALSAMNDLFQNFDLLVKTIDRAVMLRKQVPKFLISSAESQLREIEYLLTGNSIQLGEQQIPLAQRDLLSAAQTQNAIAPAKLLEVMTAAFQVAKDVVVAVETARSHLAAQLTRAQTEMRSLQTLADSLGIRRSNELAVAQQNLLDFGDRIICDPLGVSDEFEREIEPIIIRSRQYLEEIARQKASVKQELSQAHQLLQNLIHLNQQHQTIFAEYQEKITEAATRSQPLADEQIEALNQWLARLEIKFKEGIFQPVKIGLQNWRVRTQEYLSAQQQAYTDNQTALEMRQELRGRLQALQAKALAKGMAENEQLSQIAQQAKQLLYTRPTPLGQAIQLVSEYEKLLNRSFKSI